MANAASRREGKGATSRDQLLVGAVRHLAVAGTTEFSVAALCVELGQPPSIVNYYFDSREGLIQEAVTVAYEQYVDLQMQAVDGACGDAEEALTAWVLAQIDWTVRHPGIASILNFSRVSDPFALNVNATLKVRLEEAATRNLRLIGTIVADLQGVTHEPGLIERSEIEQLPRVVAAAAMVAWLTLGHATWRAGQHIPTNSIEAVRQIVDRVSPLVPTVALTIARGEFVVVPSNAQGLGKKRS